MAKKTVRQQDFMKKKLKVGKPKQKPSNVTDTSFQMKWISLPSQTRISGPGSGKGDGSGIDLNAEMVKRVTLLRHHSDVTRKETVIYYESMIPRIIHLPCMSNLMQAAIPLICDSSKQVRDELVKLFDTIGKNDPNVLKLQIRALTLYLNNAMTHIITPIQRDAGMFMQVLMRYCGDDLVRQAWIKMLKGFFQVLGWTLTAPNSSKKAQTTSMGITNSSVVSMNKNKKHKNENLKAMLEFIRIGTGALSTQEQNDQTATQSDADAATATAAPAPYLPYMMPEFPQPYAYLKLFIKQFSQDSVSRATNSSTNLNSTGAVSDDASLQELETLSFEDPITRTKIFQQYFYPSIKRQLPALIKDGGECGRTAHSFSNVLQQIIE